MFSPLLPRRARGAVHAGRQWVQGADLRARSQRAAGPRHRARMPPPAGAAPGVAPAAHAGCGACPCCWCSLPLVLLCCVPCPWRSFLLLLHVLGMAHASSLFIPLDRPLLLLNLLSLHSSLTHPPTYPHTHTHTLTHVYAQAHCSALFMLALPALVRALAEAPCCCCSCPALFVPGAPSFHAPACAWHGTSTIPVPLLSRSCRTSSSLSSAPSSLPLTTLPSTPSSLPIPFMQALCSAALASRGHAAEAAQGVAFHGLNGACVEGAYRVVGAVARSTCCGGQGRHAASVGVVGAPASAPPAA